MLKSTGPEGNDEGKKSIAQSTFRGKRYRLHGAWLMQRLPTSIRQVFPDEKCNYFANCQHRRNLSGNILCPALALIVWMETHFCSWRTTASWRSRCTPTIHLTLWGGVTSGWPRNSCRRLVALRCVRSKLVVVIACSVATPQRSPLSYSLKSFNSLHFFQEERTWIRILS